MSWLAGYYDSQLYSGQYRINTIDIFDNFEVQALYSFEAISLSFNSKRLIALTIDNAGLLFF